LTNIYLEKIEFYIHLLISPLIRFTFGCTSTWIHCDRTVFCYGKSWYVCWLKPLVSRRLEGSAFKDHHCPIAKATKFQLFESGDMGLHVMVASPLAQKLDLVMLPQTLW